MTRTEKKPSAQKRKIGIFLRRMEVWLDAWCLRGYQQDTSAWATKVEKLRSLKKTSRQIR